MPTYNPKEIEPRWQQFWESNKTFRTPDLSDKPKIYLLDMFPYPSGDGLHVGHPEGYTATDILSRYRRMRGYNVMHPMGWDAFGLPAEQHAIKKKTHPRDFTLKNIATFRRQIKMLGFSYDWDREIDTTDPGYVKWTQWIFLQLFDTWYDVEQKKGRPIGELPIPADIAAQGETAVRSYRDSKRLAYQAEVPVNWCPELGTVLANEEVIDGKSERGDHPVIRMPLRQWLLRITAYAERLIDDLALVDWPESIKKMQRDWIGRSEGAEVDFEVRPMERRAYNKQTAPASAEAPIKIRVFTTRPDTLFGATYLVLSPEHPLLDRVTTDDQRSAVREYQAQAARKSDMERTELAKKKTGVFSGGYALNPVNGESIPIWVADYVLSTYGTGAIMAVPAHDERDLEFAQQFRLPIRPVVLPPRAWLEVTRVFKTLQEMDKADNDVKPSNLEQVPDDTRTLTQFEAHVIAKSAKLMGKRKDAQGSIEGLYRQNVELFECFSDEGTAINSGSFDGLSTSEFKTKITAWLEEQGKGTKKTNYKLRDWLFSRQRYWGEPFPILHELDDHGKPTGMIEAVPVSDLPVRLPELDDFQPTGNPEPPLTKATDWLHVTKGAKRYVRETNTMPQWAGSCWYYLRYLDPHNAATFCDPAKEKYWLPVDTYVGGAEHAVLHLLYSRFWHKVLFDRGHVHTPEPFKRLVNQGMILGEMEFAAFQDNGGAWLSAENVEESGAENYKRVRLEGAAVEKRGDHFVLKQEPAIRVDARMFKMSKARGNVINPDDVVSQYGADSLRLYEMFMGPLEATKPWNMRGVEGVSRFLNRVWRLIIDADSEELKLQEAVQEIETDRDTERLLNQTIKRITDDLENLSFNTAIAAMMEFCNHLTKQTTRSRSALSTFVLLLSPFAPHLAEELWRVLGHADTLAYEPWPGYDERLLKADEVEVPVQVNGKIRAKIIVGVEIDKAELEAAARADERIATQLEGKTIRKVIVVPGKLVNFVVG